MNRAERRRLGIDKLIVYSAHCTWWDSISKVAKNPAGLPCCPHCGSVLFETSEKQWQTNVFRHNEKEPGYLRFIEWARGKCFPNYEEAKAAWAEEMEKQQS